FPTGRLRARSGAGRGRARAPPARPPLVPPSCSWPVGTPLFATGCLLSGRCDYFPHRRAVSFAGLSRAGTKPGDVLGAGTPGGGAERKQKTAPHGAGPGREAGGYTATISVTSGTCALMMRSIPAFKVSIDIGQTPQAPISCTVTTPSSETSTSCTSPPRSEEHTS